MSVEPEPKSLAPVPAIQNRMGSDSTALAKTSSLDWDIATDPSVSANDAF